MSDNINRDDPAYLCGFYEAKLEAMRAVASVEYSTFFSSATTRILRILLDMDELCVSDQSPVEAPIKPEVEVVEVL